MTVSVHVVLGAALDAARVALHDLDADQVPNDLRRVVAHSGALVPPIAKALVKGLDKYEWLREKAADAAGIHSGLRVTDACRLRGGRFARIWPRAPVLRYDS